MKRKFIEPNNKACDNQNSKFCLSQISNENDSIVLQKIILSNENRFKTLGRIPGLSVLFSDLIIFKTSHFLTNRYPLF
jgi:hypothetical protein